MSSFVLPGKRIVVVGTTGCGKTTLADRLAASLGYPHTELDSLYWGPGWTPAPDFQERAVRAAEGECWVFDGNYRRLLEENVWPLADTVVWLDYSLPTILWRLARRTLRRVVYDEELWNGNHEGVRDQLFSSESLFLYACQTHRPRRERYASIFSDPRWTHLRLFRLLTPRQTSRWLEFVASQQ